MYLIKQIGISNWTKNLRVEDGILAIDLPTGLSICDSWWGKSKGTVLDGAELSKNSVGYNILTYVTSFNFSKIADCRVCFDFSVGLYTPDKIDGFLVFVPSSLSCTTNGEVILGFNLSQYIIKLCENNFVKINGATFKVNEGKLWHQT